MRLYKREVSFALAVLLVCLVVPGVSAAISVSQPLPVYSIGDAFKFNVTLAENSNTNDFLNAGIVCGIGGDETEREIFRSPVSVKMGDPKFVSFEGVFDNLVVGTLSGRCALHVAYGSEWARSVSFEISREIKVSSTLDRAVLEPRENFKISGIASNKNGLASEGFVEIKSAGIGLDYAGKVEKGAFSESFQIADATPAGDYPISIRVYERDESGKITNEGYTSLSLSVKQVISSIGLAIQSMNAKPGNDFEYSIFIKDQSGLEMSGDAEVTISNPNGNVFSKAVLRPDETGVFRVLSNYTPGNWNIEARNGEIKDQRTFYVEEFENISYYLVGDTLNVINSGNTPVKKSIGVILNGESQLKDVDLVAGASTQYKLSAPDGNYVVGVRNGEQVSDVGAAALTGKAVDVSEIDSGKPSNFGYAFIWILMIAMAGFIAVYLYGKIANMPYFGRTPSSSGFASVRKSEAPKEEVKSGAMISNGEKQDCSFIALGVRNMAELKGKPGSGLDTLSRIVDKAKDARAKVYEDANYKTIIFAPSVTLEKENNVLAIKTAKEIGDMLRDHNRKFAQKIDFGMGVHQGEMIAELVDGNFKFNALGGAISGAKRIAERARMDVGISDSVHRKLIGKVKADRVPGENYWTVRRFIDRNQHSEFIDRFMGRQKK